MKKQSSFIFLPTKDILLPTDKVIRKVGDVIMQPSDGRVAIANVLTIEDPQECIPQYIYLLSDEKPKETEWAYCPFHLGGKIFKAKGKGFICNDCKKIIATNNPELLEKWTSTPHGTYKVEDGVAMISPSDVAYIISLHNRKEKGTDVSKLITKYTKRLISDYPEEDKIHITLMGFLNESKEQPKGDEVMVEYEHPHDKVSVDWENRTMTLYPKLKDGYIVIIK